MHIPAINLSEIASLTAFAAGMVSIWGVSVRRNRGRKVIEARLASLGETPVEISSKPFCSAAWGTAGLTAGAIVHRVISRTATGEERVREWAYDPTVTGGLKSFSHGIWIPES